MSLGEAVVEVGADASRFGADLERDVKKAAGRAETALSKIGRGTTKAGRNLSLGVTAPLVALAGQAVKTQGTFEQSMNLLAVNAQLGGRELAKMGDLAKKMGADTVFSAVEAADAMLELSKGGFKAAQISGGGIQATMALAATEGLALADAATITGNAMNAFSLKAKDASQIADSLAAGSVASSASVASLAEGLGNVGPIAKQSGLSLQDTVAALAQLDQAGIKGAEGGTAVRSFLTRLVPTGKKAKDAIRALGLEFTNADGSFRDFGEISQQLQDKLGGLTEAQRAERLQTIFGAYAKQAAAVFLEGGAKGYAKFTKEVEKSGTAQELADARMKGTNGALEKMRGSVETAGLAIGEALAPTVVKLAGKIEDLANWFTELDDGAQQTIVVLAGVAAALGPVLFIAGKTITTINTLSGAYTKLATTMSTTAGRAQVMGGVLRGVAGVGGMALLADSTRRTGSAFGYLESTLGGAAAGFAVGGPIGAGVGALGGAFLALTKQLNSNSGEVEESKKVWSDYTATLDEATAAISRQTREQVRDTLEKNGALSAIRVLGIEERTAVQATLGNVAARKELTKALQKAADAGQDYQALQIAEKLGIESSALRANRIKQLEKSIAIAKTAEEAQRLQRKLDKLSTTTASPTVNVQGVPEAIKGLTAVQKLINEISGSKPTAGIKPNTSLSGLLGGKKERATGGPVTAGMTYLVGERGPELFTPTTSGRVLSNQDSRRAANNPFSGAPIKKLNRLLDEHKQKLQDLQSAYNDVASSAASAFQPDQFSGGLGALLGSQNRALAELPQVIAGIEKLRGQGVSPAFMSQLIASGNIGLITALAAGSAAQAKTVEGNFDRIQALTGQIGQQAASISPEAQQLAQVTRELQQIKKLLAKQPKRQGEETSRALNKTAAGAKRRKRRPGP